MAKADDGCIFVVVEDRVSSQRYYAQLLEEAHPYFETLCSRIDVRTFETPGEFSAWYRTSPERDRLRLLVLDWEFPGGVTAKDVIPEIRDHPSALVIVVLSSRLTQGRTQREVTEALGEEASRHVVEPIAKARIPLRREKAAKFLGPRIRRHLVAAMRNPSLIAQDNALRVAETDPWGPILLLGPSGAGKTWLVRHHAAARGLRLEEVATGTENWEFVVSDMFGHVKGAYTGALWHRLGRAMLAGGVDAGDISSEENNIVRWLAQRNWMVFLRRWRGDAADEQAIALTVAGHRYTVVGCWLGGSGQDRIPKKAEFILPVGRRTCARHEMAALRDALNMPEGNRREGLPEDARACIEELEATQGFLFLDEVADLEPRAQLLLLKFLDGAGLQPLGYNGLPFVVPTRVVAATNKIRTWEDLEKTGFREDLYWRLSRWVIRIPGLDQLPQDRRRPMLVNKLEQVAAIWGLQVDDGARQELVGWNKPWRGGLRQVDHVCHRAAAIAKWYQSDRIGRGHVRAALQESLEVDVSLDAPARPTFEELRSLLTEKGVKWEHAHKPTPRAVALEMLVENYSKPVLLEQIEKQYIEKRYGKDRDKESAKKRSKDAAEKRGKDAAKKRSDLRNALKRLKADLEKKHVGLEIHEQGDTWTLKPKR